MTMKRLLIVGAGISGLAAAHAAGQAAAEQGLRLDIEVLERDGEVGGKARTLHDGEWLVEGGPTGYLDTEPAVDTLLAAAGMTPEKLPANQAAAHRFIVRGGRMREVQAH